MILVAIRHVETCFDGSLINEVTFNTSVTKEFIEYLGLLGKLEYFGSFPRPFYRIQSLRRFELKGVEGEPTARIRVMAESTEVLAGLTEYAGKYRRPNSS